MPQCNKYSWLYNSDLASKHVTPNPDYISGLLGVREQIVPFAGNSKIAASNKLESFFFQPEENNECLAFASERVLGTTKMTKFYL
jgi:hypothetical protein